MMEKTQKLNEERGIFRKAEEVIISETGRNVQIVWK